MRASEIESRRTGGHDAIEPRPATPDPPTNRHKQRSGRPGAPEGATVAPRSDTEQTDCTETGGAPAAPWVPGDGRAPNWWLDPLWAQARLGRIHMTDGRDAAIAAAIEARRRGADPVLLVRALWFVFRPGERERCGRQRLEQLRRALDLIERHAAGGRGAGAAAAIELAVSHIEPDEVGGGAEFKTLAGVAAALYALARKWRRTQREHRGELDPRRGRELRPMLPKRDDPGFEWPWH